MRGERLGQKQAEVDMDIKGGSSLRPKVEQGKKCPTALLGLRNGPEFTGSEKHKEKWTDLYPGAET